MDRRGGDRKIAWRIFLGGMAAEPRVGHAKPAARKPAVAFVGIADGRRAITRSLWAALLLAPHAWVVCAQTAATRVFRIGWLTGTSGAEYGAPLDSFRAGLRDAGFNEGRNYLLLLRYAEGQLEQLEMLASDLVSQNVDLIVATTPSTLAAARRATSAIPIVMVYGPDPAEAGVVSSLARPGGNVTGLTSLSVDLSVKQLQLLRQIAPNSTRVAVLWNPINPWHATALERLRSGGTSSQIVAMPLRGPNDFEGAFASIAKQRADALLCLSDPMTYIHRVRLAELAIQGRLPSMHGVTAYTEAGGLASYWPNPDSMYRRAADYSHRILSGTRPADLPVEQPRNFELVINLRTARALGIQIPPGVLTMAARTIE